MNLNSILILIVFIGLIVAVIIYANKKGEPYRPLRGSRPAVRAWRRPGNYGRNYGRNYGDFRRYQRPYGYWKNYVQPYPYYSSNVENVYDRFDYTNEYNGDLCHARISTEDAFGPYAREMGSQAWKDWAGRQGFQKVYLLRNNIGVNDHAIVKYIGECDREKRRPPNSKYYESFNATSQSY